jgi:diacylglycerol kinase family enzyme
MKIAVIANPMSGLRRSGYILQDLLKILGPEKREIESWWTEYQGHAGILAAAVRRKGYDRMIAADGDGTLLSLLSLAYFGRHTERSRIGVEHACSIKLNANPPVWIEADGE